jgi:hypothetical protein
MRIITILVGEDGYLEVREDDRTSGQLSWDEMLGQIGELTHPKLGTAHYPMMTNQQWKDKGKLRDAANVQAE